MNLIGNDDQIKMHSNTERSERVRKKESSYVRERVWIWKKKTEFIVNFAVGQQQVT